MSRLVIVGGSDAGISAGLRARQVDPGVEPLLVVADAFPNFSICGIPYHVSGEVPDWRSLAHRTRVDLEAAGLELKLDTRAQHIDPQARTVTVTGQGGREEVLSYDALVIGTGATPFRPPIQGLDGLGSRDGVHLLHTMTDTFALTETLAAQPATAVIVGAGYIGLEMAEALTARGIAVTVVEQLPQVLGTLDAPLAGLVEDELVKQGVTVQTSTAVDPFPGPGRTARAHRPRSARQPCRHAASRRPAPAAVMVSGVIAGFFIGVVAAIMGVAGDELLIPTIVLLFGTDIKAAGSLSLAVSMPTMLVAFARYSRDGSFTVLRRHARLTAVLAAGSVTGAVLGGLFLGVVPDAVLVPGLALLLVLSSVKVWQHATSE